MPALFWEKAARGLVFVLLISLWGCASLARDGREKLSLPYPAEEDINGVFPEAVYIKTRTQTFNTYHYYTLHEGLIWYKSRDPKKEPLDWTLFQKTGLPRDPWKVGFNKPERIVEISADADELAALSDEGGFYRFCFDVIITRKNNVWFDRQGWPIEEQLFLDTRTVSKLAWALGKRNGQVLYYEDPFGNQHHNGTQEIATTYVLLEDGQEIAYADTGLRSDFSRNYIGPERGAFKAAALSASASTMFVMNDAGEMYTRIADFDIVGCDPMLFKYTYIPYKSEIPGTNYFSNLTEWGLPSEDWRAQPPIPLGGKAALSRHLTILQNGQGNGARELRVAGLNGEGKTGYWTKAIFGESWIFRTVPLHLPPSSLLRNTGNPGRRGDTLDRAFRGFGWNAGKKEEVVYEIPNFNILEGSCELRITRGDETCALTLYPVELWTYQKRNFSPGRAGAPKMFLVTISLDENALAGLSDSFAAFVQRRFGGYNKKLFHYSLAAKNTFCLLQNSVVTDQIIFLTDGTISDNFPEFEDSWYLDYSNAVANYNSAELTVENQFLRPGQVKAKIELNKRLRERLKAEIREADELKLLGFGVEFGYLPLDGIARLSPLQFIDVPKIRTMTRFGARIVLLNNAYTYQVSDIQRWLNQTVIYLLDLRIACYAELAKRLPEGGSPVSLPPWYSEGISAYWDIAGFPRKVRGTFSIPRLYQTEELPADLTFTIPETGKQVFGWHLAFDTSPSFTLFVDPGKSLKTIYGRKGKSPGELPLSVDCTLYVNSEAKTGFEQTFADWSLAPFSKWSQRGINARLTFDGEYFEIREYPAVYGGKPIFRGKAVF
ncbi:MAG: hypothetical protein LBT87_00335 [Treponema sp.]|jgi:hypothetical protein|nr:hypothetical protein [Treponema sp.]